MTYNGRYALKTNQIHFWNNSNFWKNNHYAGDIMFIIVEIGYDLLSSNPGLYINPTWLFFTRVYLYKRGKI